MSVTFPLPADLPMTWAETDTVFAVTTDAPTPQHSYNYLNAAVNDAQTGANQLNAAIGAHIGVAGTAQHPAATDSVAGFLSAADKTKLDGFTQSGWLREVAWSSLEHNSNPTLAQFNAAADKYTMGMEYCPNGSIHFFQDESGWSNNTVYLYSMVINVLSPTSPVIKCLGHDDVWTIYLDGTNVYQVTGYSQTPITYTMSLSAGTHVVQMMINNLGQLHMLMIADWFNANIQFLRAATS
jgi:hypothetical protein